MEPLEVQDLRDDLREGGFGDGDRDEQRAEQEDGRELFAARAVHLGEDDRDGCRPAEDEQSGLENTRDRGGPGGGRQRPRDDEGWEDAVDEGQPHDRCEQSGGTPYLLLEAKGDWVA